ncbi:MAG TPA: hypothetical protein VFQ65_12210 [Kofleriaceae bacterium]|nr:hypothetical protein [Kofleriaceae bacterium]
MMRALRVAVIVAAGLALGARYAAAYPQFQLVKDQTCSGCHLSPAGGGLLSENGLNTAEAISQWGTAPEFFYKKVPLPSWLQLGGDLRGASGFDQSDTSHKGFVMFPMQAEVYAAATFDAFSLHVTGGVRDPQYQNTAKTLFASREHWVQWQQRPGETEGLFVRVGRFMPVFGLREAEHPYYDRRYGGTPLYGETYAAAVEYLDPNWEVHATGFIHDPILTDSIERGNGATAYAEARVTATTIAGVEAKVDITPDDKTTYVGVVGKQAVGTNVLVQADVQIVHHKIDAGGIENQIVATAIGSYLIGPFMIDLGLNNYHENLSYALLDQESVDLNAHWFATSHLELILTNRFQMLAFGADGESSGYSLLQVHYRL